MYTKIGGWGRGPGEAKSPRNTVVVFWNLGRYSGVLYYSRVEGTCTAQCFGVLIVDYQYKYLVPGTTGRQSNPFELCKYLV